MTGASRVFIDVNVFVTNWTTDVLLTLADWGLVSPFWSDRVMEEAAEAIREVKGVDPTRYIETIRAAFDRAEVTVEDADLAGIELPDPDDRHVVAGMREAGCDVVVTYNLKDFLISRAMLRACGVPVSRWPRMASGARVVCEAEVAPEVMAAFRNFGSPMDGGAW